MTNMNLCKEKYIFKIKGLMCQVIQSKQILILSLYLPHLMWGKYNDNIKHVESLVYQ